MVDGSKCRSRDRNRKAHNTISTNISIISPTLTFCQAVPKKRRDGHLVAFDRSVANCLFSLVTVVFPLTNMIHTLVEDLSEETAPLLDQYLLNKPINNHYCDDALLSVPCVQSTRISVFRFWFFFYLENKEIGYTTTNATSYL